MCIKKIPHTRDKASLDQCRQQHRYYSRVDNKYTKTHFFLKTEKFIKNAKTQNVQKYFNISDTPFDQRSLIHWEAWFPGGQRIPQNPIFLKNKKNYSKRKKSKSLEICQNQQYALRPEVSNPSESMVSTKKTFFVLFGNFRPLPNKKCLNLRPLLSITFPQGFQISLNIGHLTSGSGGTKTFKRYLKVNRRTYGHTDTQPDKLTYRKHRPRGPML